MLLRLSVAMLASTPNSSRPQRVAGRPGLQLVEIFAAPCDHLGEAFVPADLRLPADVAFDRRRVEPIARVLSKPVACHLAKLIERDAQRLGGALDNLADRRRQRWAGVVNGA